MNFGLVNYDFKIFLRLFRDKWRYLLINPKSDFVGKTIAVHFTEVKRQYAMITKMTIPVYEMVEASAAPDAWKFGINIRFASMLITSAIAEMTIFNSGFPLPAMSFDNILPTLKAIVPGISNNNG